MADAATLERLTRGLETVAEANVLRELAVPLLRLLAAGRPVAPEELAAAVGRPPEEVRRLLDAAPSLERDEEGRILGSGLTLVETPHRFEVRGHPLYTWCALDTLLFPALLGEPARVESRCPVSGAPVRLDVVPAGVVSVEPPDAVVSLVVPRPGEPIRASFCNDVHFFRSRREGESWLRAHPHATLVSVEEAVHIGREIAGRVFRSPSRRSSTTGHVGCC